MYAGAVLEFIIFQLIKDVILNAWHEFEVSRLIARQWHVRQAN